MESPRKIKLNRDGLPIDARDFTEDDWRILYNAIEAAKREIAARHQPEDTRAENAREDDHN